VSQRVALHAELAGRLARRSDGELLSLLDEVDGTPGWGMSWTLDVEDQQVFVKALPVTALELDQLGSTRNLFGLPAVYHYGVGSAGFGAAREVAAHVPTGRTC